MSIPPPRLILAITGASGAILGIRALEMLRQANVETHLVITASARVTIAQETDRRVEDIIALASHSYDPEDMGAAIASGSFVTRGMLVVPCSIKTLSAIANSFSHNLVARAADVCLKEGRPLVLAVREAPLHRGHIRLMSLAAKSGAILFPPIPAFYGRPQSLEEVVDGMVGRMLLRLGIDNSAYTRWVGTTPDQQK
jgi:flavin prenyltransferase